MPPALITTMYESIAPTAEDFLPVCSWHLSHPPNAYSLREVARQGVSGAPVR